MSEHFKIHKELESLLPPLDEQELKQLEDNVLEDGIREPLIVARIKSKELLCDGHNRLSIARKFDLNYELKYVEFASLVDVKVWMIRNQHGRRNLTDWWTYKIGVVLQKLLLEKGKKKKKAAGSKYGEGHGKEVLTTVVKTSEHNTRKEFAEDLGWSEGKVAKADKVLKDADEDIIKELESGEKTINEAFNEIKKAERKKDIAEQKKVIELGLETKVEGLFDVVVLDPPWNYGTKFDSGGRRVANPYPEMTQTELLKMDIPFADDAVVWLWTTHKFLPDAFELLTSWGFEYKATIVWDKEKIGMGHWLRMQCEFCLLGIKGKPFFDNTTERDIIREARREHSRKPEAFYTLVSKVCAGRKLDYFSRTEREGWSVFGNETNKF